VFPQLTQLTGAQSLPFPGAQAVGGALDATMHTIAELKHTQQEAEYTVHMFNILSSTLADLGRTGRLELFNNHRDAFRNLLEKVESALVMLEGYNGGDWFRVMNRICSASEGAMRFKECRKHIKEGIMVRTIPV
jgi:hypothetical protein